MIQVKEFVDTDNSYAEKTANEFLGELHESQFVSICYGSIMKPAQSGMATQRSTILIAYRTTRRESE